MHVTIPVPEERVEELSESEHGVEESLRRAVDLYCLLENPDEVLEERGLWEGVEA